jgi:hypothetical protein
VVGGVVDLECERTASAHLLIGCLPVPGPPAAVDVIDVASALEALRRPLDAHVALRVPACTGVFAMIGARRPRADRSRPSEESFGRSSCNGLGVSESVVERVHPSRDGCALVSPLGFAKKKVT